MALPHHDKDEGLAIASHPTVLAEQEPDPPTISHVLAGESLQAEAEDKGASQLQHDEVEVNDIGWNDDVERVSQPIVGGLANEQMWTLIRRFNKQIFHVKSIEEPPLANLDMNIADEEEFSPEKLRAQVERLYMVVLVSLLSGWKHVVRLRSWKETRRTAAFLAVYGIAWLLDVLVPAGIMFLMVLVLLPRSRAACFPPAPPALINSRTGGVQKPLAGVLASDDTLTGAPEKHRGEGVEQEAHSFVDSIVTISSGLVVSTGGGKNLQAEPEKEDNAPEVTASVFEARDNTGGEEASASHDKTKKPMMSAAWEQTRPLMHIIADTVDTWERLRNALSPTAPFPKRRPGITLASCLVPLLLASYLTTSYMLLKVLGFAVGFGFFGDPILTPLVSLVNHSYPRWRRYVELRHSILRGVPTNAQLTITLLRIGEKNRAPVPPPPTSDVPPAVETDPEKVQGLEHLGVTKEEVREATEPDTAAVQAGDAREKDQQPKKSRRLLNAIKSTAKGGIHTILTADKAKAAAGAPHAKKRRGVVQSQDMKAVTGPVCFPARFKGRRGHAYVTSTATSPALSWTSGGKGGEGVEAAWTVSISDMDELLKVGGLGWKSKLVVGWALEKQVMDGLVVRTKQGKEYHLTAIVVRDELFNRLIAMGSQMWEAR